MDGVLLLNKPLGWTSHDAVDFLRRRLGQKKIGHAGTLDPMATGLLVMLVGKATRRSEELSGLDKDYRGSLRLGVITDTWDMEGRILTESAAGHFTREEVQAVLATMQGSQTLPTPAFSAVKKKGKKAYELARQGVAVEPPPRDVTLSEFFLEKFLSPEAFFFVRCSKGTYVRSVAHVVGQKLGCGAALSSLTRTRVGPMPLSKALTASQIERASLASIETDLLNGVL